MNIAHGQDRGAPRLLSRGNKASAIDAHTTFANVPPADTNSLCRASWRTDPGVQATLPADENFRTNSIQVRPASRRQRKGPI
jgi:hypothetical protein